MLGPSFVTQYFVSILVSQSFLPRKRKLVTLLVLILM